MVKLGNRVRDNITGFSGVATGKTEWLYGCNRICIEPAELHEGKPIEAQWFDEQRVEIITEDKPKISADNSALSGGPQKDPFPRKAG